MLPVMHSKVDGFVFTYGICTLLTLLIQVQTISSQDHWLGWSEI